jgi:hypothetical protein
MIRTLIAIINAHSRQGYQDAIRETWLPRVIPQGLDYRFFRGRGANREPMSDEVFLDCGDGYESLPEKIQGVMRWALSQGYEFTLKLDDDTVLLPEKFSVSGYDLHDFVGNIIGDGGQTVVPWGFAWILSKTSMEIIANEPLPDNNNDEYWVAYALLKHGIHLQSDERYRIHKVGDEDLIAPLTRADGPPLSRSKTLRSSRPLRSPMRTVPRDNKEMDPKVFCVCMFYTQGERLPDEKNIAEMRKLWPRL